MRVEEPENGFKDFILNLTKAYRILKRNILLIIVVTLLFSVVSALFAKHFKSATYLSSSSFIMEGNQDNAGMGIMNLASQFGVGGTGGSGIDENKLVFIFQTRKIIEAALLDTLFFDRNTFTIEKIIDEYQLDENWPTKLDHETLINYRSGKWSSQVDSLIMETVDFVRDHLILANVSDEGIMFLNVETTSKSISYSLNKSLLDKIMKYFNSYSLEKDQITLDKMQVKVDSIINKLFKLEDDYAHVLETSSSNIRIAGKLDQIRLKREIEIQNVMYAESVKNLELTKFKLLNNDMQLQILDAPSKSMKKLQTSWLMLSIVGGFIGLYLSATFVLFASYIRAIKSEL